MIDGCGKQTVLLELSIHIYLLHVQLNSGFTSSRCNFFRGDMQVRNLRKLWYIQRKSHLQNLGMPLLRSFPCFSNWPDTATQAETKNFSAILEKSKWYLHNCVTARESDSHWQNLHELSKPSMSHDGNLCCSKEIKISPLVDLRKNKLIHLIMLNGVFNNFGAFVYRR